MSDKHTARRRAEEVLARVEGTLSAPRPEGPTWEAPVRQPPVSMAQPSPRRDRDEVETLSPEAMRRWNSWGEALIQRRLEATVGVMGEEVAKVIARERQGMRAHVAAELVKIRSEHAAEVSVLQAQVERMQHQLDAS